jgi:signal transduction histidine kinase
MKRFGLRAQFIVVIAVFLLLIFAAISYVLIRNNITTFRNNLRQESKAFAALATKPIGDTYVLYHDAGSLKITEQIENFSSLDPAISNVSVVDVNGKLLFSQAHNNKEPVSVNDAGSFDPVYKTEKSGALKRVIYPYFEESGAHRYSLVYDISSVNIDRNIRDITRSIIVFCLAALLISAILVYLLIRQLFLVPLQKISKQALAISAGNLSQPIEIGRRDEIGDMAMAVSKMATTLKDDINKLQGLDKLKTEFMIIASHNLRTPIGVINGYIDILKDKDLPEDAKQMINMMGASNRELSAFAEDLLTISQIENSDKATPMNKEPVVMNDFINDIVKDFSVLATNKGVAFEAHIPDYQQEIMLNRMNFRSAVWNILDNALKFTSVNGKITLEVVLRGNEMVLSVEDTGIGISDEELPRLFTKFHRGTDIFRYNFEGTGIGLYATKLIVDQHGGNIEVKSTYGKGTIVTITIPISNAVKTL